MLLRTLSLLAVLILPIALAHSPDPNANCSVVHDETLTLADTLTLAVTVPGTTMYVAEDATLWTESNAWPGLQTHAHVCRSGGETRTLGADAPLAL